ncbi:ACN9 family protein [Heterostelium album PN500]|uniref:Succinate dehydrogenase assembly factor 3 n=1 Tax=Heterostelium pallidum (strain ATCC 26659 / Pp 5 / PN500) TaxID=670386 RepID=D3B4A6_HETP5|nr:ACN9 family protein [Heterostelium album PN500]EFA84154.1 ACN9 family protein [Heterostelium album PN500]|eukprot:XP_020436271.1 ACN9 family protein [Heterostelium album PN500]
MNSKTKYLQLYRNILRCHRFLQEPMRSMGDQYVKTEWRLHKNVDQRIATIFYKKWDEYLQYIINQREQTIQDVASGRAEPTGTDMSIGRDLSSLESHKLSNSQKDQLKKLREEVEALNKNQ